MIEVSKIERTCARAYRAVDGEVPDQVTLLRAARMLKRVQNDLRLALWEQERGGSRPASLAAGRLVELDESLRRILLGHAALSDDQIRTSLLNALDTSFDLLEWLQA